MSARRAALRGARHRHALRVALALTLVLAQGARADPAAPPSPQTLVFWNARLALRDGAPLEVMKLWMLHNALMAQGAGDPHAIDLRTALWVALGATGHCPDGLDGDEAGAGLWPLALFNWALQWQRRGDPAEQPAPWTAFVGGLQQRTFTLHDVLSAEELRTMRFHRSSCLAHRWVIPRLRTWHWVEREDRVSVGVMMRDLLELGRSTVRRDRVVGTALLETRLFDMEAALSKMVAGRMQAEVTFTEQLLRAAGVSAEGAQLIRAARVGEFRDGPRAKLWQAALAWSGDEWITLGEARRLALFTDMQAALASRPGNEGRVGATGGHEDGDEEEGDTRARAHDAIVLRVVDALIDARRGFEVESWLAFAGVSQARGRMIDALIEGERGERLLALGRESGFRGRSAVAIHRGVRAVQRGEVLRALRSFAFALRHATDLHDGDAAAALARRWLAFVLSQYATDDEVISTLETLVPARELPALLEGLLWRAAFHVDGESFERVARGARPGSALAALAERLRPLARGDAAGVWDAPAESGAEQTAAGLVVFTERLVAALSLEPFDVRLRNAPTLRRASGALVGVQAIAGRGLARKVTALQGRIQVLLDGVGEHDASVRGRASSAAPERETYAGSVRLAPSDALPWPFTVPAVKAPDPFAPLRFTPMEWRDADGTLVYGWRIHE